MQGSLPQRLAPWLLAAVAVLLGLSFGACTQDDAFISFRYAENLLAGHGLVYNPGELVEGITNLLWTLLLAGCMALGAEPVVSSTLLGLLALAGLVLISARLGAPRALAGRLAAALVAMDAALALEAVQGLETVFYTLLVTAGILLGLKESASGKSHLPSSALFGLAALTRPEGPLLWAGLHAGLALETWRSAGRGAALRQLRRTALGAWPLFLLLAGLLAWRWTTYGELVPNTWYAKSGGGIHALQRGLRYLWLHALCHPLLWLLVAARPFAGPRSPASLTVAAVAGLHLLYVIHVGGDFKATFRFVAPVLPCLALLAAESALLLAGRAKPALRWALALALAGLALHGYLPLYQSNASVARDRHANLEARKMAGDWLAAAFPAQTWMAIHSAGVIPYYAGLPTIDMWGLSDKHIARVRNPNQGKGMPGHEKTDPAYVFARQPTLYLPEDHVIILQPHRQEPEPGFPADFAKRYKPVCLPVKGRWINMWVRRDLPIAECQAAG